MSIKEGLKTVEKRSILLLRWFLRAALIVVFIGILTTGENQTDTDTQYLLLLTVILICQGVWGAVLLDCLFRRFRKKD